jgi:hypothetical protein
MFPKYIHVFNLPAPTREMDVRFTDPYAIAGGYSNGAVMLASCSDPQYLVAGIQGVPFAPALPASALRHFVFPVDVTALYVVTEENLPPDFVVPEVPDTSPICVSGFDYGGNSPEIPAGRLACQLAFRDFRDPTHAYLSPVGFTDFRSIAGKRRNYLLAHGWSVYNGEISVS